MELDHNIIPVILFISIAGVLGVFSYFNFKAKKEQQETLRQSIAAGHKIDDETLKLFIKQPATPEADLRTGILSTSIGFGVLCAAIYAYYAMTSNDELSLLLAIVGIVNLSSGIGHIISWNLRSKLFKSSN